MNSPIYYHYTSIPSCLSILSSRRVWLTDYRFLNDKHELTRALALFLQHLGGEHQAAMERAMLWHDLAHHHCVLSLSRSQRILSQWRAYAADGKGVAMGFRQQFLEYAKIELVPCIYEDHERYAEEIAHRHECFVSEVYAARQEYRGENTFMAWIEENHRGFAAIVRDLIALKNPAFTEEQEVRAVIPVDREQIRVRAREDLLIPYTEAEFWPADESTSSMHVVVPEIWLGPKCDELNRTALRAALQGVCNIERYDCGYT